MPDWPLVSCAGPVSVTLRSARLAGAAVLVRENVARGDPATEAEPVQVPVLPVAVTVTAAVPSSSVMTEPPMNVPVGTGGRRGERDRAPPRPGCRPRR